MSLRILAGPTPVLVQDSGRTGWADQGVGSSGVFDRGALRQANELVGNPAESAVLELAGGGFVLRATRPHTIAVTGAVGPLWIDGRPVTSHRTLRLPANSTLEFGQPTLGARWVLGVTGGVDVPPVLGSRSRDTLAELGPEPLGPTELVGVGVGPNDVPPAAVEPALAAAPFRVRLIIGPRDDWFTSESVSRLFTRTWTVSALTSRVGSRLDGPGLQRAREGELLSEPVVRGSIQVTNDGTPIVLGPDHPVTGGYPVVAVVVDRDLDLFAQMRPGEEILFERATVPETSHT